MMNGRDLSRAVGNVSVLICHGIGPIGYSFLRSVGPVK